MERGEKNTTVRMKQHTPPHATVLHNTARQQQHSSNAAHPHRTSPHTTHGRKREQNNTRAPYPTQDRGHHTLHPPRHSTRPPSERKRGRRHSRDGGRQHADGESVTPPPFPHHATHHHNSTPPSTMAPPTTTVRGRADRGYPTTRTTHRDTHPHTPHTQQRTMHDMTAVLASTAMR